MKYIYNRSLRDIATFVVKTKVRKLDNGRLHILSFQIQSHMRSSMLRFYRKNRKTECLWIRKLKSHQHSMYIASIFWKKELTAGMLEGGGRGGARPSRFWPHPYCPWKMVHWPVRSPVQACCRPCNMPGQESEQVNALFSMDTMWQKCFELSSPSITNCNPKYDYKTI